MKPTVTTINVRYCDTAGQWLAWFEGTPCVTYGAEFSMQAVHRLLNGYGTDTCDLTLRVEQADTSVVTHPAVWQPPELLLHCEECDGKGEYVGLAVVEKCGACRGKGWVPG